MHAVFTVSIIDTNRLEEADTLAKETIMAKIQGSAGFVSATIARSADNTEGRGMFVFESEDSANSALASVREAMPTDSPITMKTAKIFEVKFQI
jgi:hypothetical protein